VYQLPHRVPGSTAVHDDPVTVSKQASLHPAGDYLEKKTDPFLDLEVMQEHNHRRCGAAAPGKRKKYGRVGELVDDDAVIIPGGGPAEQAPQGRIEKVKRTEKIGAAGKLETIDLHPPLFQELDNLPVVQIATGDLPERTIDNEQKPHSLRIDVGRPGSFGFPDLHLKLDDGFDVKVAMSQAFHKSRMDVLGHVLHTYLPVFEKLQIIQQFALDCIDQLLKLFLHYGYIHRKSVFIQNMGRAGPLHHVFVLMGESFLAKITDKEMARPEGILDADLVHCSLLLYGSNTI
jgi:hypothetical protein